MNWLWFLNRRAAWTGAIKKKREDAGAGAQVAKQFVINGLRDSFRFLCLLHFFVCF
jgi:hypothetical protein